MTLVANAFSLFLMAGWPGSAPHADELKRASDVSSELAFQEEGEAPTFVSLAGQRAAVSIDASLAPSDLARIIEEDPRATQCTDALIRAQWQQNFANRLLAAAHFDNCQIDASLRYMREEYAKANEFAESRDVFSALRHLGHVLHSIQDFYGHTNFVELASERYPKFASLVPLVLWDESNTGELKRLRPELVSGRSFKEALWDSGLCPKGTPTYKFMNKDSPDTKRGKEPILSWRMTHYRAALELTEMSARKLLRETMKSPAWSAVVKECGSTYGFGLRGDVREE